MTTLVVALALCVGLAHAIQSKTASIFDDPQYWDDTNPDYSVRLRLVVAIADRDIQVTGMTMVSVRRNIFKAGNFTFVS
jgi:hypothetical protein